LSLFIIPLLGGLTSLSATAWGQTISLTWDANTDPSVIGYKIYYKADSDTPPFNGNDLPGKPSPMDVGNATTIDIDLPEDGRIYYFSATAYDEAGFESAYSNIIASDWIPNLIYPIETDTAQSQVAFEWGYPPPGESVTYTLYYGPDANLAGLLPPEPSDPHQQQRHLVASLVAFGFLFCVYPALAHRMRPRALQLALSLCLVTFFVGCGGGGGDSAYDSPLPGSPSGGNPVPTQTVVVANLQTTYYDADNLQPGETYYWKVVATDANGNAHSSLTHSFVVQ